MSFICTSMNSTHFSADLRSLIFNTLAQRNTIIHKFDKDLPASSRLTLRAAPFNTSTLFAGETDKAFQDLQKIKQTKDRNISISFHPQVFLKPVIQNPGAINRGFLNPGKGSLPQHPPFQRPQTDGERRPLQRGPKIGEPQNPRGVEGLEEDTPDSDSTQNPRSPFWETWERMGADPWVASTLRSGYNLEFQEVHLFQTTPFSISTANILR